MFGEINSILQEVEELIEKITMIIDIKNPLDH